MSAKLLRFSSIWMHSTLLALIQGRNLLGGEIYSRLFFVCVLGAMESKEEMQKPQIAFIASKKVVLNDK